ncbi:hypothetical protein [Arthrobacter sp. NEB 688]|uniref:sunset domain-containing protein n=1 Tax=Arthrobacter sp. NEB 688 TaxID=904039 RepID=UPI001563D603|nr:hypothetical protein [Arthrobacter sp. NEB 688]QKE82831.1 hypothetical protein HL663_01940 [Arthrobacter sp. NEB 688]
MSIDTPLLVAVVAVVVIGLLVAWLLVRRSSARKDAARAEAAGLRAQAEGLAPAVAGQEAFAAQSEERAAVARAEAERLAAEAEARRADAEATRTDYEELLTRADVVDPDVETPEHAQEAVAAAAEPAPVDAAADEDADPAPTTRAEARRLREEAERSAWAGSPAAPVPGAAGAAVMGAEIAAEGHHAAGEEPTTSDEAPDAGWSPARVATPEEATAPVDASTTQTLPADEVRADEVHDADVVDEPVDADPVPSAPEDVVPASAPAPLESVTAPVEDASEPSAADHASARIATAADYRDDTADGTDVWTAPVVGTDDAVSSDHDETSAADDARTPSGEWGGPREPEGETAAAAEEPTTTPAPAGDAPAVSEPAVGEAGTEDETDTVGATEDAGDEPAPVSPTPDTDGPEASRVVEDPAAGAFAEPEEPVPGDVHDPSTERDWSADEAELLDENRERGDRLAQERAEMDRDAAAVGMDPVDPASADDTPAHDETAHDETAHDETAHDETVDEPAPAPVDEPVAGEPADVTSTHDADAVAAEGSHDDAPADEPQDDATPATARRVSEFHEVRDGGYGMGSAAALDDGAQPLDHPVQAYRDTMSYRLPDDPGYADAVADVWFYDAAAAERSGFHRSQG